MSTNKKSGKADQGSRLYLQEYMAHAQDELSELTLAASPSLLAFVDVIVEYFIVSGKYNIFEINEVLFRYDQQLLGG